MAGFRAVRSFGSHDGRSEASRQVHERIGAFLFDQRLEPNPTNYAIAYQVVTVPDGPLARAVATLTGGGARLTQRDVHVLGREASPPPEEPKTTNEQTQGLVAKTQMQVEGFADMMTAMRAETEGFGRDLAASAAALDRSREAAGDRIMLDEVARITGAMLQRVRIAESRLDSATREAHDLRQKLEEARDNARRDPLTDLPNRRAFEESYAAQMRAGSDLCVAVCDVDHFKSVNDRFGHVVGDRVLQAIGDALTRACAGHLVARYGGEEFAVLFSGMSVARACVTLDQARASVAAKRYRVRDSDEPLGEITFSAGLARAQMGEALTGVFQRADALLYSAKSGGRNCVRAE